MSTPTDIAGKTLAIGTAFAVLAVATAAGLIFGRGVGFAIVGAAAIVFVALGAYIRWSDRPRFLAPETKRSDSALRP